MNNFHTPVLLKEVVDGLQVEAGKKYIDATIGGGGHTKRILELGGVALGIDVDQDAIDYLKEKLKIWERLTLVRGNFRDIDKIARLNNFSPPAGGVSGIIFDLGVSSYQLEKAERGFSFQKQGPLDMRMDKDLDIGAKDLIKVLTKRELYEIFSRLGEEGGASALSRDIVRARSIKPIEKTLDLARLIRPSSRPRIFQALRIAVNDELNALRFALPKALELLESGGRILAISFHSLEDRIVKQNFIRFENEMKGEIITKKPIVPSSLEMQRNRKSRSAKLRIFEKI